MLLRLPFSPVHFGLFADGVAGCHTAVAGPFGSAGAGSGGFRHRSGTGGAPVDAGEPATDPAGGEPVGVKWLLPGAAQVLGRAARQSQLGVGGQDQPGPPVVSLRLLYLVFCPLDRVYAAVPYGRDR